MTLRKPQVFLTFVVHHLLNFGLSLVIQVCDWSTAVNLSSIDLWLIDKYRLPPALLFFLQVDLSEDISPYINSGECGHPKLV